MPIDLSTNQIIEKNKLSSINIELLLLEIVYFTEAPVRACLNNETITWNSNDYLPVIFSLSGLKETKDAEVPGVSLTFTDLTRRIIPHIENYNGGIGATVAIRVVDSIYLSNPSPKKEHVMEIIDCSINSQYIVTLKLGAENLLNRKCPQDRYLKNHCRFKFGGSRCGYTITGGETCNLTYTNCETHNNESRFGGFPGVGSIGFKV